MSKSRSWRNAGLNLSPDQMVIVLKKMKIWKRGSKIGTVVKFFFSEKGKILENIEACWRTLLLQGITLLYLYPSSTGTDGDVKKRMDRSGEMSITSRPIEIRRWGKGGCNLLHRAWICLILAYRSSTFIFYFDLPFFQFIIDLCYEI